MSRQEAAQVELTLLLQEKAGAGPSRLSWSNCLAATVTSTRKHQAAFRKVCLSPLTPQKMASLANSSFLRGLDSEVWACSLFS